MNAVRVGPDRARCRAAACNAEILWVETTSGRRMPIDPERLAQFERGTMVFTDDATVRAARPDDRGPFFRSHFATCVDADRFRR